MKIVGILVLGIVGVVLLLLIFGLASGAEGTGAVRTVCRMVADVTRAIASVFRNGGGDGPAPA